MTTFEPGEIHQVRRVTGPGLFWGLFIDPGLMSSIGQESGITGGIHFKSLENIIPDLFCQFRRLHALIEGEATLLERQSAFAESIHSLLRYSAEQPPRPTKQNKNQGLRRVRDFLHTHFDKEITLDSLCAESSLSKYHLVRAFKDAYGVPPHAYQIQLRIAAARKQIECGGHPDYSSFADQSHFIRHFKRIVGLTPGQYAATIHAGRRRSCIGVPVKATVLELHALRAVESP